MKLMHHAIRVILIIAIGCNSGGGMSGDEPRIAAKEGPSAAYNNADPKWLTPATALSPTNDALDEYRVEIRVSADGRLTLGRPTSRVDATLEEIDRRLRDRKEGDLFENDLLVSRPIVSIDVAPRAPWLHVLSVLRLCEVWHHRRVSLSVDGQRIGLQLPSNTGQDYPPIPEEACVWMSLARDHGTSAAAVRCDSGWGDLESSGRRIGDTAKQVTHVPVVAVLDIEPDVESVDVVRFFGFLRDSDIRWFICETPAPPK